jgi:dUTP pyrophosphatase
VKLRYKRLAEAAVPPRKAHASDAGFDLCMTERQWLEPSRTYKIGTGLVLCAPAGHFLDIRERSSLKVKGIMIAGVVDEGYRQEVYLLVTNTSLYPYEVKAQDRIAQLLVLPVPECEAVEVDEVDETERKGGLGSTGSNARPSGNGG